jgi:hypothetical protein
MNGILKGGQKDLFEDSNISVFLEQTEKTGYLSV